MGCVPLAYWPYVSMHCAGDVSQHALCRGCIPACTGQGVSAWGVFTQGVFVWGVSAQEGVCPGGCLPRRVSAQEGVCPGGCLPRGVCLGGVCPGGVCQEGGCLPMGVSAQGRGCLPRRGCVADMPLDQRQAPPSPVNRITDRCKSITLTQLRCGR